MLVERAEFPGWYSEFPGGNVYPIYICRYMDDYQELCEWMRTNNVKFYLLSSAFDYTFQVKSNHEWFILRWL